MKVFKPCFATGEGDSHNSVTEVERCYRKNQEEIKERWECIGPAEAPSSGVESMEAASRSEDSGSDALLAVGLPASA